MHNLGAITDRMMWAGERFARGYRAVHDVSSSVGAQRDGFDPWAPRGNGPSIGAQLGFAMLLDGVGRDYQQACEAMDAYDRNRTDRVTGARREATPRGTIRRIVQAVACEERSCGELDRVAGKQNGWAAGLLKDGLRIYLELFGKIFTREVPGYLRAGAR